jgi:hypothetical protein
VAEVAGNDPVTLTASAARTATGNSGPIALWDEGMYLHVALNASPVSGTSPSMTLSIEWSHDGTTFAPAETPDAFTAITAAAVKAKTFQIKANTFRLVWTISGTTPSFTFATTGYVTGS